MDSSELSLDRIQEYLADLGYQGVPEETLLQLRGELLRRMASGTRDVEQDQEEEYAESPVRHRRRRQPRHSTDVGDDARSDDLHPQPLTRDRGYVSTHHPDQPQNMPTKRALQHHDDEEEEPGNYYNPRGVQRPTSVHYKPGSTNDSGYHNMRLSRKLGSARPMGSSGYGQSTSMSKYRTEDGSVYETSKSALFGSGASKYTLREKKIRKSDPVSNWARYTNMWDAQGGLDDVRKRETRPRYMNYSASKGSVYRQAYD